jgi:hypothetical protein
MAYYRSFEVAVITGSEAEYVQATKVSPEFFRVFAAEPVIGRPFAAEELKLGGGALMISYSFGRAIMAGTLVCWDSPFVGLANRCRSSACCHRASASRIGRMCGIQPIRFREN